MILTFTNFTPSQTTASGKTAPPKVKASDGHTYALGKYVDAAMVLSAVASGAELECEVASKQSGGYTNWYLNKAVAVQGAVVKAETAAPSAEKIAPTRVETPSDSSLSGAAGDVTTAPGKKPAASPFVSDSDRQELIVRQSAIKAAIELKSFEQYADLSVWDLAEEIVSWVYKSGQVNRTAGVETSNGAPAVQSSAQQHLAAARQKAEDIWATYDDADAVCPSCGRKEYLKQWTGGWFCARSKVAGQPGGCGYPAKGERLDAPVTYGEFKERSLRRPDAPVVSPTNTPSRVR